MVSLSRPQLPTTGVKIVHMHMNLGQEWEIGPPLNADKAGFGRIINVTAKDGTRAVAKLIPKDPGAERELLFGETDAVRDARNVVPIWDTGEHGDDLVLVMPKADRSLRQHLKAASGPLEFSEAVEILRDIATALVDLSGHVVHRDLKPENVLRLGDSWCVADFGISRYAEATTAKDTRKHAMTPPYAAPEQWLQKQATSATDIYALGIIGYELLSGQRPFDGPDYYDQHLHGVPPKLTAGTSRLRVLVEECLYKPSEARPTPTNVLAKLNAATEEPTKPGASRLAEANRMEVERLAADHARAQSEASEKERRVALAKVAIMAFDSITEQLTEVIKTNAPTATLARIYKNQWRAQLRSGKLQISDVESVSNNDWGGPFDVIATASIRVNCDDDGYGYRGRSHSLWYCDASTKGQYAWFELAFMKFAFSTQPAIVPFHLDPRGSAEAFSGVMGTTQLAWSLEELDRGDLDDFIDRWIEWFAQAANRELHKPRTLPER